MSLNFNIEPFYDDYSEGKKFYRILFRPGYAIQARELTQLQTILQQQIKRHGDHMFKNGAMIIPGQVSYDSKTAYAKLKAISASSTTVKTFAILSSVIGKTYKGKTSKVQAIVLTATPLEVVNNVSEADTIFVKYTRGSGTFTSGEIIEPVDGSSGLDLQIEETSFDELAQGHGTTASIQEGVYYVKNHFVYVEAQTTVLAKYSDEASAKCGLQVNESVIYPEEDDSLLDNALGSPNYAAPGSARYSIELTLTSKSYASTTDDDEFITLLTIKAGVVQFLVNKTAYAQIEKTFARRTYDESGDYTVRDFPIQVREYRNNDRGTWDNNKTFIKGDIVVSGGIKYKCITQHTSSISGIFAEGSNWLEDTTPPFNYGLYQGPTYSLTPSTDVVPLTRKISLAVEPGKAYVRGYEVEKIVTQYLTLDKARDLSNYEAKSIDTSPGNYVIVGSTHFLPDINTDVTFYDKYGTAGATPSGGNIVATARIKQIQLHNSSPSSPLTYKVFLFRLSISPDKVFSRDAKYLYSDVGAVGAIDFTARVIPTLTQLTVTISSANSTTLSGINTTFIQDLKTGDYVYFNSNPYRVENIATNNSIDVSLIDGVAVGTVSAGTNIYLVEATIESPRSEISYYRLPAYAVNNTKNLNYSFYKKYTTSSGVYNATFSESGYVFGVSTDFKNYIVVNASTGAHLTQIQTGTPSSAQFSVSVTANGASVTLTFGSSGAYVVICNVRKAVDGSTPRLKTLTNITETVILSGSPLPLELSRGDGFELISVTQGTPAVDITSRFKFDNGAKAAYYDLSSITVKPGFTATTTGSVDVTYSYFNHGSSSDYFTIDSYTHGSSNILYEEIPSDRISILDFRPLRDLNGTFSSVVIPKYAEETDICFNYYLGRFDKLSLTTTGEFIITRGIPDLDPSVPPSPKDSMDLYTFNVEPYTFTGSAASVVPNKIENKRYTMRDIGRLESRINNLEYYTTLSLLEQNTVNNKAYDNYGLERPQNGFIVDDFTGQGVGSALSVDWKASIDIKAAEVRPSFTQTNISLLESIGANLNRAGRNYEVNGDLATLKILSTTPLVSQPRASHSESVNPFNIFIFNGLLEIVPWNDSWFETARRPDIIINDTSQYDALVSKAESDGVLGTVYRSWSTNWGGEQVTGTQRVRAIHNQLVFGVAALDNQLGFGPGQGWGIRVVEFETFSQEGTKTYSGGTNTFIQSNVTDKIIDDRVVSTEIVPYIRSRKIVFRGDSFKPETPMHAFFDGINVDTYITPAKYIVFQPYGTTTIPTFATQVNVGSNINNENRKTSGAVSTVSTAYSYGEVLTEFVIIDGAAAAPTGVSCIVLGQETYSGSTNSGVNYAYIDNIKGGSGSLGSDSNTHVYYLQAEFDSARRVKKVGVVTTPSVLTTTHTGQLFGSFDIPNGTAASFRTGVRTLRFTDNAANIRANAASSAEATYSATGILETTERTILSTKSASLVIERIPDVTEIMPTQTGVRVTSDTGWFDPLAQTFLVDVDGGVFLTDVDLFFSNKDENVPVKIQIRNVVNGYPGGMIIPFSETIKRPAEVTTSTNATSATNFKFRSPVYLQNGVEYALVVISDSAKYKVWLAQTGEVDINGSGLISEQPYAGVLFKSQNASTWTADQNQDLKFNINRAVFDTSSTATLNLINQHVPDDVNYDLARINVNRIVLPGTTITSFMNNVNAVSGNNIAIGLEEDISFNQSQKLAGYVEEAGTASFSSSITMSTTKSNISPVIDLSRCSATLVSNIIESSDSSVDNETIPEIGNATAKYVTKRIKLNVPSTHLRMLFDANIPNEAGLDVYYKTGLQSTNFAAQSYTKLASYTKPFIYSDNPRLFYEVESQLNLTEFDIVQFKIVMKSKNTSKVPRVKALRVIAYA